jgi:uncharacterized tellurite resistance protein B-like protein
MTSPIDERFYTELLKLLLQVASSDDHIDARELDALVSAGRRWKVPAPELDRLTQALATGKPLPPPHLGLLRQHPDEVLSTVHTLIHSDAQVHLAEEEMTAQIRELLGLPPG